MELLSFPGAQPPFPVPHIKAINDCRIIVIDNAFTHSECKDLMDKALAQSRKSWEPVAQKSEIGDQVVRQCERILWDSPEVVSQIWSRLQSNCAEFHKQSHEGQEWKATRLNERMRFVKYNSGDYFQCEYLLNV